LFEESIGALADCRVIGRNSGGGSLRKGEGNDGEGEGEEQNIWKRFSLETEMMVPFHENLL
jgi:hypothetical protein